MACTIRTKPILAGIGLLGSLALGPPAVAANATATFQVTATVQATCLISATNLSFGTYAGVQTDALSTVTVTCTNTTPYNVGLSAGLATGATVTTRKMTGPGTGLLAYSLSQNDGRTINWGNTIGTDTEIGTGNPPHRRSPCLAVCRPDSSWHLPHTPTRSPPPSPSEQ